MKKKILNKFIILILVQLFLFLVLEVNLYSEEIISNNVFDEGITFNVNYHEKEDVMPYCLIAPSTADRYESIPLIVYLHGGGEINSSKSVLLDNTNGLPQIFENWPLDGFNAYILMPHLKETEYDGWCNNTTFNNVKNLIDKIIENYNIDTDNIIISGGSTGGIGSMYYAANMSEYFSKLVVISGYYISDYKNVTIPTRGYVGASSDTAIDFMNGSFSSYFGKENLYILQGFTHHTVLHGTFKQDEDNNNRSDLIEWLFKDLVLKPVATGIKLNKTQIELLETKTEKLTASMVPENATPKEIIWKSEDEAVAKVENGIVTAISEGTTNITATTADGKFKDTCKFTVQKIVLNSNKYSINDNLIITKVLPNTSVTEFIASITTNGTVELLNKKAENIEGTDIITTGTILNIKEKNLEYKVAVTGDLDGNGKITATDVLKLKRHMVKLEEFIGEYLYSADIDYDKHITSTDILKLKRVLCNIEML